MCCSGVELSWIEAQSIWGTERRGAQAGPWLPCRDDTESALWTGEGLGRWAFGGGRAHAHVQGRDRVLDNHGVARVSYGLVLHSRRLNVPGPSPVAFNHITLLCYFVCVFDRSILSFFAH